jgi:hypothetical protein
VNALKTFSLAHLVAFIGVVGVQQLMGLVAVGLVKEVRINLLQGHPSSSSSHNPSFESNKKPAFLEFPFLPFNRQHEP